MQFNRLLFALATLCFLHVVAYSNDVKSVQDIAIISPDSLAIPSYLSKHFGDTVIVRGKAVNNVLINATGGDRRPIMLISKSWLTYISGADVSVEPKAGIAIFQRDTNVRTTQFDKIKTGDIIECTAIVTNLPYEFDDFNQVRRSLPALELITTTPVKTISRNSELDTIPVLNVSDFYTGTRARNPKTTASIYAGRKVRFDSVVISSTSPVIMFSDGNGNEIPMSDQSGYFTTKNHFIEESQFASYTVGQKIFKVEGFITTSFIAGGGGGQGGGSQLYTYAIAPALQQDVNAGPKPAVISLVTQRPTKLFPSSKDKIEIIYDVLSGTHLVTMENIALNVSIDGGNTYTKYPAQEDLTGSWIGTIPAQAAGTIVRYYLSAIDEKGNLYRLPVSTDYFYKVVDTYPSIADVKMPDTIDAIRNMNGASVTVEGIVMCDSSDIFGDRFQNQARAVVQDGNGAYSGATFYRQGNNSRAMQLKRGQKVRLTSRLQEFGGVVFFGNIDSIEVLGNETPYMPVTLKTSDFTTNAGGVEGSDKWRDMLVEFNNVVIGTIEPSAPQSTGEFIIVDEASQQDMTSGIRVETDESKLKYTTRDSIVSITNRVKPTIGEKVTFVRGIIGADFRSRRYKLIPRFDRDFSIVTSANEQVSLNNGLSIFPNPASETVFISHHSQGSDIISIRIADMITGKVLKSIEKSSSVDMQLLECSTHDLPSGIYSVKVQQGMNVNIIPLTVKH
jgi:hypothetical protein